MDEQQIRGVSELELLREIVSLNRIRDGLIEKVRIYQHDFDGAENINDALDRYRGNKKFLKSDLRQVYKLRSALAQTDNRIVALYNLYKRYFPVPNSLAPEERKYLDSFEGELKERETKTLEEFLNVLFISMDSL